MYEDNDRLIQEYQEGHRELLGVIVENNLGLIHTALKSFKWAYNNHPKYDEIISYDDFYNEGVIGLCGCIDKYNPELGAFSTFAIIHIKQAIFRFYYDKGRVIRVPYEPRKLYKAIRRAEEEYTKRYGHEPSMKELSLYTGVSTDDILESRRALSDPVYLDSPIGGSEGDSISISDTIPDHTDYLEGTEKNLTIQALRRDLKRMADDVIKDEKKVKILFFYFDNLDKMLVKDMVVQCNLTKSKFDRIIDDGIRKIYVKYLDELIEGYADLYSSNIRRTREKGLFASSVRTGLHTVISRMLNLGDSITVIEVLSENALRESIQATVRAIEEEGVILGYVAYDRDSKEFKAIEKHIPYKSIVDMRTENKKVVEIACKGSAL